MGSPEAYNLVESQGSLKTERDGDAGSKASAVPPTGGLAFREPVSAIADKTRAGSGGRPGRRHRASLTTPLDLSLAKRHPPRGAEPGALSVHPSSAPPRAIGTVAHEPLKHTYFSCCKIFEP